MADLIHSELAVITDNGINNAYKVDYDLVNSKAYHDKFEGLTHHKALDEGLYRRAAKMLEHRSGSPYEDIAMLDARTGEVLMENTSAAGNVKFKAGLTYSQVEKLNTMGVHFEILHNHPNSSPPSSDDIKWLFRRPLAVASNIIGHDGTLYRMTKLKGIENIADVLQNMFEDLQERHPDWSREHLEYVLVEEVMDTFCRRGYIHYIRR